MEVRETPKTGSRVKSEDLTQLVAIEQLEARGIDAAALCARLADAAARELATYYGSTVAAAGRMGPDERDACSAIARASRDHFEALAARVSQLGGALPPDLAAPASSDGNRDPVGSGPGAQAASPRPPGPATPADLLGMLAEAREGIRRWWALCDATCGRDHRTFALAQRILDAKIDQEARLVALLAAPRRAPDPRANGSSGLTVTGPGL